MVDSPLTSAATAAPTPSSYTGFPSFEEWRRCDFDARPWERAMSALRDEQTTDILRRARAVIRRAARGVGAGAPGHSTVEAAWDAALDTASAPHDRDARRFVASQLPARAYAMDFAVRNRQISAAWLRGLHSRVCRAQTAYIIQKADGTRARVPLWSGYKRLPNRVARGAAPPLLGAPAGGVAGEMRRYCGELRGGPFLSAHPVLQASYAHYALVRVHPFADGNGRVARALAFAFIYRSNLVPALVLDGARGSYVRSLERADDGEFRPFIDHVMGCAIEAAAAVCEDIRRALCEGDSGESVKTAGRT